MESLLEDIRNKTTVNSLERVRDSILDTAKIIKSNDATFKISTLPAVSVQLTTLMREYVESVQRIEASQKAFLKVHDEIEKLEDEQETDGDYTCLRTFTNKFNETVDKECAKSTTREIEAQLELEKIIRPNVDEEIQFEAPTRQLPKDPITKRDIKIAVKSNVCGHIYDQDGIEDYFAQKARAKKTRVQCPVAGCTNKTMTRDEMVLDEETNKLIQSL